MRDAFSAGRYELKTEERVFDLADYNRFLSDESESIGTFKDTQQLAFAEERQRWLETGQLNFSVEDAGTQDDHDEVPEGCHGVQSPVPGSVWKLTVTAGQRVEFGQELVVLESMKMEMSIEAPATGLVRELRIDPGQSVQAGQVLVVIED
jgi:urea carboxylase